MSVSNTLAARQKTHGNYDKQAQTAQELKQCMKHGENWKALSPQMKESLELIATKISRILHGDPNHADSWHDIAGYAELITASHLST